MAERFEGRDVRLKRAFQNSLSPTFFRWFLVGLFSLFLDIALFAYVFELTNLIIFSNFLASIVSTSFNYTTHYFWTFKSEINHKQSLFRYFLNICILWILGTILIKIFLMMNFSAIYSKSLSLLIVLPLNFFTLSKFVYKAIE
jgi:putative flippase GtrA